jgi:hypothetical protein
MTCIYCERATSGAEGRAHVFPEAIVANEIVLPRGTVCDRCNNYLSELDRVLVLHNHIWPVIQVLGFPGKKGHVRKKLGFMERTDSDHPWRIRVGNEDISRITFDRSGVHIETKDPVGFDFLKFRRALHHVAFNFLALDCGIEYVTDRRFDQGRRYIRMPKPKEAWPYAQVIVQPHGIRSALGVGRVPDAPGEIVVLRIFNDDFFVDLLNTGELHSWARDCLPAGTGLL